MGFPGPDFPIALEMGAGSGYDRISIATFNGAPEGWSGFRDANVQCMEVLFYGHIAEQGSQGAKPRV